MQVKICGITRLADALAALEAGADLLGFNFYSKSPRFLSLAACAAISGELRRRASPALLVGVFVNPSQAEVELALERCGLDLAQLSGDEPAELVRALGGRAFKALRPASAQELDQALLDYPARALPPALLLDANRPGAYGGTGQAADWDLAAEAARRVPVLLAGGLTPLNVAEAIRRVQPWGVDVASGVESAPGRKDGQKMAEFVRAAHNKSQSHDAGRAD
jgi:phosphoribosylanthranilate isomerase